MRPIPSNRLSRPRVGLHSVQRIDHLPVAVEQSALGVAPDPQCGAAGSEDCAEDALPPPTPRQTTLGLPVEWVGQGPQGGWTIGDVCVCGGGELRGTSKTTDITQQTPKETGKTKDEAHCAKITKSQERALMALQEKRAGTNTAQARPAR